MARTFIGIVFALFGFILFFTMIGAQWGLFVHISEIVGVLIISIALLIATVGIKAFIKALNCVAGLRLAEDSDRAVLKRWITATYGAGLVVFLAGIISTLSVIDQGTMVLAYKTAAAISSLLIAGIVSEFFLRTALSRTS
ncbi:hypothetical protein MLD52_10625 [Puniceicoccaceae bacterium K14]|nr:hypothetical protein [Puniceicoccaceae bacterium K14]